MEINTNVVKQAESSRRSTEAATDVEGTDGKNHHMISRTAGWTGTVAVQSSSANMTRLLLAR